MGAQHALVDVLGLFEASGVGKPHVEVTLQSVGHRHAVHADTTAMHAVRFPIFQPRFSLANPFKVRPVSFVITNMHSEADGKEARMTGRLAT